MFDHKNVKKEYLYSRAHDHRRHLPRQSNDGLNEGGEDREAVKRGSYSMWCLAGIVVVVAAAIAATARLPEGRVVHLEVPGLGTLAGSLNVSSWTQRTIYQFQGIPFAKPPTGNLRFMPPEPAEPWTGILDATRMRRKCPMIHRSSKEQHVRDWEALLRDPNPEDCLHLNVYTTKINVTTLDPVMVYFHGGSFRVGSAHEFWPNYLLEHDIVLVVPQYRLGPLGFLSLQTREIPGNAGMLDQILALKWVQKYIRFFGGDPRQVTIFGQSAGGATVTLLLVSPLVDSGLFKQAIAQSGSALGTWVMDSEPVKHARKIASLVNCTQSDLEPLTECLKQVPAVALIFAHSNYLIDDLLNGGRGIGGNHPVIQTAGDERFLLESPLTSIQNGRYLRVPLMGGVTRHEGSFILGNIYDIILQHFKLLNDTDYLTHNLTRATLHYSGVDDSTGMITDVLTEKYFKPEELGDFKAMTPGLIDICGVALLKASTFRFVQENSRHSPSFLYSFNYYGQHTKFGYGEDVDYPFSGGVSHSDDLIYLFPQPNLELNAQDQEMSRTMVELWTNFAILGKPAPAHKVPNWPPVSGERGPYLRIDSISEVRENFLDEYVIAVSEGFEPLHKTSAGSRYSHTLPVLVSVWFLLHLD